MNGQDIKTILGKNVKFFRFHRQFSQADLAERADISITFLSNIERGNTFPKAETLSRLAQGLDVPVYELFKPEAGVSDDAKEVLVRFSDDIKKNLIQTLETVYTQYSVL